LLSDAFADEERARNDMLREDARVVSELTAG